MAVIEQKITEQYAVYNGDCIDVMGELPDKSIDLSIYSPPFAGLYIYSSDTRDLSNCSTREQFLQHYEFVVAEIARLTKAGRLTLVHTADVPALNHSLYDLPGDMIRLHEKLGFLYMGRRVIWKEPLGVFIRTRALTLKHGQLVKDAALSGVAGADYLLAFRKGGENKVPIKHPDGLTNYAGSRRPTAEVMARYAEWDDSRTNKLSHWIWQQYASSVWDDVRIDRVLPYKKARDPEDERHIHPLQLDVIERGVVLWSNPGETVLTPFMGVGSEMYGALTLGRRGIGIELKPTYYRQALKNIESINQQTPSDQEALFAPALDAKNPGGDPVRGLDRGCPLGLGREQP